MMIKPAAQQAHQALDEVVRQRRQMAASIRVPTWYAIAYGAAMMLAFISPALVGESAGGPLVELITAAIIVLGLLDGVVSRTSRARLSIHNARSYPSVRGPLIAMAAAIVTGSAITWLALAHISRGAALASGILSAVAVLATRAWALAAVRNDIRSGEAG